MVSRGLYTDRAGHPLPDDFYPQEVSMSTLPVPVPMPGPPDKPPIGLPVVFGMILIALSGLAVVIGEVADDFTPLGVPSYYFVYATVVITVALVVGRSAVAAFGIFGSKTREFGHGFSTYLAVGMTILEGLPLVLSEVADSAAPLNVDPAVWLKATGIIGTSLLVGKYLQGAAVFLNRTKADPATARQAFDDALGAGLPPLGPPTQPGEMPQTPPGEDVGPIVGDGPGAGPDEGLPKG